MRGWIHLYAFAVSIIAGVVLISVVAAVAEPRATVAVAIYSVTIWGIFGVSALYHRVTWKSPSKRIWMKRADHSMIFLFIAGSYTPFGMLALSPETGRIVLSIVWGGALAGVALKMLWPTSPSWFAVPLYIMLGWVVAFVIPDLVANAGVTSLVLLAVGGVLYSVGAVLYATKWPNPWPTTFGHHEFFHAATVIAAICHYVAVWLIALN
ncbi:hemolysin III family protein [Hoyosella rhizosphaerae]|nr:hemolysin III family protein [Hoyosella rhizosphaerae]MBN4925668.1 hemolysin III family protein [Hoyosella rhizosphaerae]